MPARLRAGLFVKFAYMKIDLSLWIEIAAFVCSVIVFKATRHSYLKWFLPFLFVTAVIELTGAYRAQVLQLSNHPIYNIYSPVGILFYAYIFSIHLKQFKKLVWSSVIILVSFAIINLAFIQGMGKFNSYTQIIGSFIIIIFSCLYLYTLMNMEQYQNLLKIPMFWITTGLLFSCLFSFVYWSFFELQVDYRGTLFRLLVKNAVIVRYSCFIIALICKKIT
jgi:hypothetical protein